MQTPQFQKKMGFNSVKDSKQSTQKAKPKGVRTNQERLESFLKT